MEKKNRQKLILDVIEANVILTQDDLQNRLSEAGISATQSTLSRDIKELRIIKALDGNGVYRYINPLNVTPAAETKQSKNHYMDVFNHSVLTINSAMNDVVVKCYPGMASSACVALDNLFGDMILGSLAGEDTIFVITRDAVQAQALVQRLKKLL